MEEMCLKQEQLPDSHLDPTPLLISELSFPFRTSRFVLSLLHKIKGFILTCNVSQGTWIRELMLIRVLKVEQKIGCGGSFHPAKNQELVGNCTSDSFLIQTLSFCFMQCGKTMHYGKTKSAFRGSGSIQYLLLLVFNLPVDSNHKTGCA